MQPFQKFTSCIIPLPFDDIDTDQIIPARYLKVTNKAGLAEGLFYEWRYFADGSPNPEFPLNLVKYKDCQILLAGENFGCGSSREHAPWALVGYGFRSIISTSYADIFYNNALKNGLLPIIVDYKSHRKLLQMIDEKSSVQLTVDLASQILFLPDGDTVSFPIDAFSKQCLLEGVDSLGYLLRHEAQIVAYEAYFQPAWAQGFLP